jgi:GNAT superfamily N-acetyltransferase
MNILRTKVLSAAQFSQINQMWNDEYPLKLKDRFSLLLEGVSNFTHYLIEEEQTVQAWAVVFEKDAELRFSIIVSETRQGKGLGKVLIEALKADYEVLLGWVIDHNEDVKSNGTFYQTPMPFYVKQGFEILNDLRIDTEMIRAVKIKWSKE